MLFFKIKSVLEKKKVYYGILVLKKSLQKHENVLQYPLSSTHCEIKTNPLLAQKETIFIPKATNGRF